MNLIDYLAEKQKLVNKALAKEFESFGKMPKVLYDAMHYAVFSGGKRIRPILVLATFEACNGKNLSWILPFACGIELIHTFSLINDDLPCMDNDDYRRGKLTLHRAFDETVAILAANGLFAKAFELFSQSAAPPLRRIRAISDIAKVIGAEGIIAGQYDDICQGKSILRNKVYQIAQKKTAEFIAIAIKTGAVIAGTNEERIKKLYQAGIDLGMLFQITDDILDASSDKAQKPTFVRIFGEGQAKMMATKLAKRTRQRFSLLGKRFFWLQAITDWIAKRSN
uniref:Polyprenyl synthetase family protein n=1 Tax=candidate division WOR-3 bacterium TaxID=2052148 RepID=A0A7C6EBS9_UNCW3